MKLLDLLKTRKRLAEELNARRAESALAERTVSLCDVAAKTIPGMLTQIRSNPSDTPRFGSLCAPDDVLSNRHDLARGCEVDGALVRLQADLPAIRAFWVEKAKAAAA